jgi:hypothetical protein
MIPKKFIVGIFSILILSGCQSMLRPQSIRNLRGIQKAGNSISPAKSKSSRINRQDVYQKEKVQTIEPLAQGGDKGQLFNPSNRSGFLFGSPTLLSVGDVVDLDVKWNIADSNDDEAGKPNDDEKLDEAALSAEEKKIRDALPNLDSKDPKKIAIKKLRMKVSSVLPNGDFVLTSSKNVGTLDKERTIELQARLPFRDFAGTPSISTESLTDINWLEVDQGEIIERRSTNWQNEYTLRLSGFSEENSRAALALKEKEEQLKAARKLLENQLVSMGKQRVKVAATRSDASKLKAESSQAVEKLQQQIVEKDKTIATQRQELDKANGGVK